jgi:hypothetical protein
MRGILREILGAGIKHVVLLSSRSALIGDPSNAGIDGHQAHGGYGFWGYWHTDEGVNHGSTYGGD